MVKHRRVMEISRRWSPPKIEESRDIDVATHGNVSVVISVPEVRGRGKEFSKMIYLNEL